MSDVECPYCGKGQEINHDDGAGYEEGCLHEQECSDCEKTFTFYTTISFDYEAYKADCLNGGEHKWRKPTKIWFDEKQNKELWHRRCTDCERREQGYNPEWKLIEVGK